MKYNVVLVCCPDDFIRNSRDYARSAEIHTKGSADRTIRFWSCGRLHKVNIALNFIFFLSRWFRFLTWPPSFICKFSPTEDGYYSLFRWWTNDVLVNAFFSVNWLFLAVVLLFWVRYLFQFSASLCCSTINQSILIKKFNQYWFKNYKLSKTQLVWGNFATVRVIRTNLRFFRKNLIFFIVEIFLEWSIRASSRSSRNWISFCITSLRSDFLVMRRERFYPLYQKHTGETHCYYRIIHLLVCHALVTGSQTLKNLYK